MIKKLRRSFVAAVMFSALGLVVVVVGAINLINVINMERTTTELLDYIAEHDGVITSPAEEYNAFDYLNPLSDVYFNEELSYKNRFFIVDYAADGSVGITNLEHISALNKEAAVAMADEAIASKRTGGYNSSFYKYKVVVSDSATKVYFLDINQQLASVGSMATISVLIALVSLGLLLVVVLLASGRVVMPVAESARRQKRFINDAGHELKTPLAIISANADVLELTCGKNEWIDSIHKQTKRMSLLVEHLLLLDKMDEKPSKKSFAEFSLSEAVKSTAESFVVVASRDGKSIETDIEQGHTFNGNCRVIEELVSVLVDNAVKYAPEESVIKIRLFKSGKTLIIETENGLLPGTPPDTKRIFDRFYRSDRSRSRETGGYGIGLSVAKAAVEMHKGTIEAKTEDSKIIFTVNFNIK